ncbi:MAG: transcription antitermination factor NusB [Lachnospiraceae bacterium]|nr:transcription antitermination factor NusB [Lachnospiraceae bacterium]
MTRRQMRIHVFNELYFKSFYEDGDFEKQCELYLSEEEVEPEDAEKLRARAEEIAKHFPELDERINSVAVGWKTGRMSRVDLAILRLAVYEAFYDGEIPEKVAFNEAVELAKSYGSDESAAFINGILGKLSREEH